MTLEVLYRIFLSPRHCFSTETRESDQNLISDYNIDTASNIKVMRLNGTTTN